MINNFKNVGQAVLRKSGYYSTDNEMEKRKIFLLHQSLIPRAVKDNSGNVLLDGKAICLNFDLKKKQTEFRLTEEELTENNRGYYLEFKLGESNDAKKFLTSNNVEYTYSALFQDALQYLDDETIKAKKQWIIENISSEFIEFVQKINDSFYMVFQNEYMLNTELFVPHQQEIINEAIEIFSKKGSKITGKVIYNYLIKKYFRIENVKPQTEFPYMICFNNRNITEYEDGKYYESYLNLCYYDLVKRFYIEKTVQNKTCHICNKSSILIKDKYPLSMKFYGTTNYLNFENIDKKNSYRSFGICENCVIEVMTGMKYIEYKQGHYLFDIPVYYIPDIEEGSDINQELYRKTIDIFSNNERYKDGLIKIKSLIEKASRKQNNFSLMFYRRNKKQFDILKIIPHIELKGLLNKFNIFDRISEDYQLFQILDYGLTLRDLRYYLFPSEKSEANNRKPDFTIYGKNLLNFLEGFLTDRKIDYYEMVSRFAEIYRRRMNNDKPDSLAPFKMVLALTIFIKLNILKKGVAMKEGANVTDVSKEEYRIFFETHEDIYSDNMYRQGLFLLGTVISKIKWAQKEKSSNFLKKLNFNGMLTRRVPNLVNQVREFSNIYKVFEEKGIWGNIMDRLQGIEKSDMKPDEVIFYLLTGISFEDYLGMKYVYEREVNK